MNSLQSSAALLSLHQELGSCHPRNFARGESQRSAISLEAKASEAQFRWRRKPAKRNFARGESLRHQARNSDGLGHTHYLASPQIWALSGRQAEACPVMRVTSGDNGPSPWGCRYRLGRVCEETGFEKATHASMVTNIVAVEISPTKRDPP